MNRDAIEKKIARIVECVSTLESLNVKCLERGEAIYSIHRKKLIRMTKTAA